MSKNSRLRRIPITVCYKFKKSPRLQRIISLFVFFTLRYMSRNGKLDSPCICLLYGTWDRYFYRILNDFSKSQGVLHLFLGIFLRYARLTRYMFITSPCLSVSLFQHSLTCPHSNIFKYNTQKIWIEFPCKKSKTLQNYSIQDSRFPPPPPPPPPPPSSLHISAIELNNNA